MLQCQYDTSDRETLTMAGRRTQEKMCWAFVMYWPRMGSKYEYCQSQPYDRFRGSPSHSCEDVINTECNGGNITTDGSVRVFEAYTTNNTCGNTIRPGELLDAVRPPVCSKPPQHWPTTDVLVPCANEMCQDAIADCARSIHCKAAARCMVDHQCPLNASQAECLSCNVTHLTPLSQCVSAQCLPFIEQCTACSSCFVCGQPSICGDRPHGDCDACASRHCQHCAETCLGNGGGLYNTVQACAQDKCGAESLVCLGNNECFLSLTSAAGCVSGGGDFITCYAATKPHPNNRVATAVFQAVSRCAAEQGCLPLSVAELGAVPSLTQALPSPAATTSESSDGTRSGATAGRASEGLETWVIVLVGT